MGWILKAPKGNAIKRQVLRVEWRQGFRRVFMKAKRDVDIGVILTQAPARFHIT